MITRNKMTYKGIMITRKFIEDLSALLSEDLETDNQSEMGYGLFPITRECSITINTDRIYEIDKIDGFIPTKSYPSRKDVPINEIGCVGNVRILLDEKVDGIIISWTTVHKCKNNKKNLIQCDCRNCVKQKSETK